ncbi:T9SS type A sorting domain-containing protein [Flavobacterium sp. GN10]|uniref:T9SS type A sorting domain-containing protein n=1 Tax=Flavobacterium tagetis TaxID=2801336 RepID=A0ABS1KJ30_9FLAO|nr:MBG domain-containing protein [Flavobacterium tagetis]MBL0739440.1 T9SS type A sorting domain-containing protein [Flavobacterium tagetis]
MKKKLLLFLTFFCVFGLHQNIKGQTLGPGDIAFIGFDTGGLDGFSFIALKNLPAGEIVYFTEEGLAADGPTESRWIGSGEPHIKWTIPPGVTCGKIISVIETTTNNVFTVTGGSTSDFVINPDGATYSFNLSAGDQMLAYQSTANTVRPAISAATITFLAGIHGDFNSLNYDSTTHWNSRSITTGLGGAESIIPPGLTNGVNCVALFPGTNEESQYFAKYTGTLVGTSAVLRASINNYTNWTFTSATSVPPGTTQGILPSNYTPNLTCTTVPSVTTTAPVTNYGALTATLGGSNTDGGDTILSRGIVWSLMPNPVIGGSNVTNLSASIGTGTFSVNATLLPSGTTIHYAAYASNSAGITYGTPASFLTNAPLSAVQSQKNACSGVNNGTATVTPSGGKAPYTYAWSTGSTAATITGLMPSNYSVNITDSEGSMTSKTFTIGQDSAIQGPYTVTNVSCFGGSNGAIDLTPTGGSGSYTYNWGGGITTQDRTNLAAGSYSVTITDSNNCSMVVSNIAVGQPTAALNGTTNVTTVACNGGSTGAIDLTPSGGTGPYTFLWNDGITTEDRAGIPVGSYSVTITDTNSCTKTISDILVTQPPLISTSATITNIACFGGNTGSIVLNPSGGVGGYSYLWNDGVTTQNRTGLIAGTYNVTISDGNSCSRPFSYTVNQSNAALGGNVTVSNASCNGGSNGSIDLTPSGGTPAYTYNWSDGPTTQDRTGLIGGTYSVTIRDAYNCSFTISNIVVGQPATALSTLTGGGQTDVSCNGGANGTATVAPTGGTPGYTYSWAPTGGTAATATGLVAGTYTVTVTDANGCQATRSYTIGQPASAISLLTGASKTDVACRGGNNGTAMVTPTGGTGAYTYSWAPSGGTAAIATGLAAGTYTVTVTDANGCQAFRTFVIAQPAAVLSAATGGGQTNVSCYGGANGTATVAPTGGTPGYTYSWNTTPIQTTASATGLSAGTYTVTVTDSKGCQATRNFSISQPPVLAASNGGQTNVSCNGGSNGTATVNVTGGTGAYTYSWAPSGGTAATASGLQAGIYTVTVQDANTCQTSQTFNISEPSVLDATQSQTDVLCNGGATGTATVTASGGSGNLTYLWSPSGGAAATATGLSAGTYTCKITDANSCFITKTFIIGEPSALNATTSQIDATCSTGGQATVTPSGGVGGYSYSWSPSGGAAATASGLTAGTYYCVITDGNGCSIMRSVTINTTNTLVATTGKTDLLCNGANTGSAWVTPSGAPGPFTYEWTPNVGNTETATGLTAGNYSVKIIASNGCSIVKNFTIAQPSAIVITPGAKTNVSCNGGNNGSASISATGGTGVYTYSWDTTPAQSTATATGLKAGTYIVTVKDANSCTKTQSVTITEPDALIATTSQTDVSCNGGSNGSATVNVTGGTGLYTYSWSPSGGTNATASGLSAGTYTVTIKDANLCQTTASVTITEPSALTATIAKTDVLCNQANNGTATVTPSGGTGTYTYSWSPSGGTDATATGLSPNTYTVTVTDANGCFVSKSVQITEPTALSATYTKTNVTCNGGDNGTASVTAIGGTGNYTYSWSPSGGTAATATGLTAGEYIVTITDENSCSTSNTITITQPDALALTTTPVAVSCHNGNNGSATVSVTGGTGAYTYSWAPSGGTAATATGLVAGTYTVTITDDNSCTATATVEVTQPANPVNLNTAVVSGITTTGASLSGTSSSTGINVDSGSCLTEVGFVYAQHANPTTADTKINVTAALGTFTNSLSGLRGNRTYYVRTYAVNSNGFINYGNEVSFTTQKYTLTIAAAAGHTKVYGTVDPVFNYTALGFANGDTNSILTGLLSRDAGENVGKYNIKLGTINPGADYVIAFTGAEFEITKANQTITWNQTLEFGCADSNNVTLTATTDSGLPVSYAIANAALGTISGSTLNITGSGNSTITATQNGDQNHNAATAVVKPIEISQSGLVIQQWANVLFFDNKSNNYVAWQWYKNGAAISGATRQYYSEIVPLNGTYHVIAKDKNGNSIKSCPIETTGTVFTKKIKIYPNPVKPGGEFTLECDFSESQLSGSEVVIYDIAGKLVQTISNVKAKNQIIAPSQTALYIVVLKLADGQLKTINLLVK